MFANLDYRHPEVIENIYEWADWFVETTGVQGFRMDAIKHIDYFFMRNFIRDVDVYKRQILSSHIHHNKDIVLCFGFNHNLTLKQT